MTSPCCYENFEGDKTDFRGGSVPDMKLLFLSWAKFASLETTSAVAAVKLSKILCLIKEKKDVKNKF